MSLVEGRVRRQTYVEQDMKTAILRNNNPNISDLNPFLLIILWELMSPLEHRIPQRIPVMRREMVMSRI